MTKAQEAKKYAAQDCNMPKSRLMDLMRKLEDTPGAAGAAKELGTIIGRLEHWQSKHGK